MKTSYPLQIISALGAGLLFGLGLIISRMIDPEKVMDFLDIFGDWDPSLAFVMLGAIVVTSIGYRILFKTQKPLFADMFRVPVSKQIDRKLIGGAALFGIGWGLAGLCPGPAIVGLTLDVTSITLFAVSMIISINLYRFFLSVSDKRKI